MPELLIRSNFRRGLNRVFDVGEYGMRLTRFSLVVLGDGEVCSGDTGEFEAALVFLGGRARVSGDGFDFPEVGRRRDVFSGRPHTVYLPRRTRYTVTALGGVDFALNESPASRDTARPCVIAPEDTRTISIGRDNFRRDATIMLDENFDSEHFYIGEGMIPSGNWSGYPPHRHDVDNPPEEIDMEETYFYRFNPQQGFGIQKVYTADKRIDEIYTIEENDTVAIAEGYHPLAAAPGYDMYYLWTMTGANNRGLISSKDPKHAWVK